LTNFALERIIYVFLIVMTIQTAIYFMQKQLGGLYPDSEIRTMTYRTLESVCNLNQTAVLRDKDKQLSANQTKRIEDIIEDLRNFRPIQYILGETEFFGLPFKVNEQVLIPRPETEELVELIMENGEWRMENEELTILDIGTGSGCIAVALAKKLPHAKVYAMDISEKALAVAEENAKLNQVHIQFIQQDILQLGFSIPNSQFSIIISNPPYITPSEKTNMAPNVLNYEPQEALFVPEDRPLLFYEAIAEFSIHYLKSDGRLFLETNSLFGKSVAEMLRRRGFRNVELKQDLAQNDRMVSAQRPEL